MNMTSKLSALSTDEEHTNEKDFCRPGTGRHDDHVRSAPAALTHPVEDEAVMAPEVIVEESTASSGSAADMILPLVHHGTDGCKSLDG